jgi:CRISPR-associated protein Cmr1
MEKVTFEVETITPMFLAGNDQSWETVKKKRDDEPEEDWHLNAELRASAFRGLLRYWHRALIGGAVSSLGEVQTYEQSLFGTTDHGSTVTVRLSDPSQDQKLFMRKNTSRNNIAGSDYLLWSMEKSGKEAKGNFKAARYYYPPGTKFHVILSVKGKGVEAQQKLNKAVGTFWLLTQLGGAGSRSRRSAGSLTAQLVATTSDTTYQLPPELSTLFLPSSNAELLRNRLGDGIKAIRKLYGFSNVPSQPAKKFDTISKDSCHIWIFQSEQTPWTTKQYSYPINGIDYNTAPYLALDAIGKSLYDYRQDKPILKRKIFGLPLPPDFKNERRASPLLLKMAQLKNGSCVCVAVLFKSLDENGSPSDYSLIENWIQDFPYKWEVTL